MEHISAQQYRETVYENQDQKAIAEYLDRIKYEGRPLRWIHCPNESKRNVISGANLKRAGMKKGFPDILIFDTPPNYPTQKGAALEMKRRVGGIVSEEQQDWLNYFEENSWVTGFAYGQDKALELLRDWGYIQDK